MKTRFNRVWLVLILILASVGRSQAQPTILQQPLNLLNQLLGDNVSMCVDAQSSSSTNLQYQWLMNGVIIPEATNACLPINDLQAFDCGAFSVLVSDGVGVAVSEPAELTVNVSVLQAIDQLIDALDLVNTNGYIRSYNTGAIKEAGTPEIIPGDPGGSEVWFQWSVPLLESSGIVTFSTLGSDFDTTMAAYTGSEPNGLTLVPSSISDDDAAGYLTSQVSFYAVKGTTYLIAVDGFYGAQGDLVVSWVLNSGSTTLPNAVPTPQSIVSSNGATVTLTSPWPGNNCDWLFNGAVIAKNTNTLVITNLSTATVGSYVARFTTSDNISVSAEPTEVQINALEDGSTSTNSVARIKFLNSANSAFTQSMPGKNSVRKLGGGGDSGGYSCSQTFSTVSDSDEPGEPVVCNQNGGHPAWYSYVAPSSGALLINTAGSTFNTILGVYVGPGNSFSTLTNIGCGYTTNYHLDGQPSVYIPNVPVGQTNYIVVEGENGASGAVQLNIGFGIPLSILSPPSSPTTGAGTNVNLSVEVSGSGPISYAWQFNGANILGATNSTLAVSNMQSSMAGTYTVVVSNLISVVTTQAVVSYVPPVVILSGPQRQSAGPGTNATFGVSVSGGGPISYTWQFDGTNLAGATDSTLTITNMQPSEAGTYTVVASNSVSTATAQAVLTYLPPVDILSETQSQSDGPGTNVTLDVDAIGSGPISYIWQFDGTNLTWATGSTLTVSNMQALDAGTYTVIVSNAISVATTKVVLNYLPPVTILSALESQSSGPGTNVIFSVSASSSGPISYTWQFDGTNLAGATDSTLTISNMQSFDAGTYTVIVSNSISVATNEAVLTYLPPVDILSGPQYFSAGPGTNLTFGVSASGSGPISYTWQFDGTNLASATDSTLTISNMQSFDAGTYTVTVSNSISAATAEVIVTYLPPVAILSAPQYLSAGPGTNLTFGVNASGSGPISYAWQLNGANILGATSSTLTITNMQPFDAGAYTVIVSNSISEATAQVFVSYVDAPMILAQPISQTVPPNGTAILNVSATGSPAPVYTWYANGTALDCNTNCLSVPAFQLANQGTYTVVVSNAFGSVTSSPALVLLKTPPAISLYGVVNGAFSLQIAGAIDTNFVIEGSSDLINWIPLYTNGVLTGALSFTDTNTALTCRFYRGTTNSF